MGSGALREDPSDGDEDSSLMSERVERAAGATAREECGDIYYPDPLTEEEDNSLEDEDSEAPLHGASSWVWEMIQGEAAQRSNSRDDTVAASIQKDDDIPVIEEDTAAARRSLLAMLFILSMLSSAPLSPSAATT
mmetsp:Transcript_11551/g.42250  ORF Transcript_11551/g.42250 Transcript_11551/m.42250 type:complete len:135 (+) Transcript_11551:95-499(+)